MTNFNLNTLKKFYFLGMALCLLGLLHSCGVPHEKLLNFQSETESGLLESQYIAEVVKIKIQTDDILSVTVSTFDTTASRIFNKPLQNVGPEGSFIGQGYLVDQEGNIEFPIVGKITVSGLTREEAIEAIKKELLIYLRDPVVDVRFLNLHVSVNGEVKVPGLYTFPDERFSLLEAITMAGDLTDFADRQNVMVIREVEKVREFGIVDLTSARAFESPYFYLSQNDVIYVRPLEEKTRRIDDPSQRALAIAGVVAPIISILVTIIVNNNNN
ncbi:MAG: polysaccharide biosynthesis/export family protein [Bacteroidota bacterium]